MAKEAKKQPKLRFPEFTSDWEQHKLGDYSEIIAGGTPNTSHSEYWNPKEIPWMSSGEINNKVIYATNDMISKIGFSKSSAKWVKEKSVLIALAGQGKTRGTVAITEIPLTTNQSIAAIQPSDSLYYKFLFQNLEGRYEELRSISSGDGIRGGLNKQILSDIIILAPTISEQRKVGDYLCTIDNLISLHQREVDKYRELKQGMLQKMFPKKGEMVPEIRFPGFTDAWEQRKLGDCFTERVERMPDGELISVTINDGIKKFSELGRHDNSNDDKSKYKKVCVGDIAYNSMRMWQGASGYSPYEGIVSPAYTVLSPNSGINSKYFAYYFKLPEMIHIFQVNSQGITSDTWNLKYPALSQIEIFVSKDEIEQTQIANFFTNLDNLIILHQRELDGYKKLKKGLLQQMFC